MTYLLVAAAFTITPHANVTHTSAESAAKYLTSQVRTGTLLFSNGDCLAVKMFTRSKYTHVAAVVVTGGKAWVYESANGAGVRKKSLKKYLEDESPDVIYAVNPAKPFSKRKSRAFCSHLEKEIGRPYGIKHHLTGNRADGIHCSEYVTDALMSCRIIHAKRPSRVSPASLAQGVIGASLYEACVAVQVKCEPETEVGRNCCEQFWFDTKACTARFCIRCRRMFVCR